MPIDIRINIKWKEVYADMGLKTPLGVMRQLENKHQSAYTEKLIGIVAEGDTLAKIETGEKNTIARLAKEEPDNPVIVETIIPKHRLKINFVKGSKLDVVA